jgi:CspA family cold shock protein
MTNTNTGGSLPFQITGKRFIGQVEWFSKRKGYGFIGWQGDKDVFVHQSAVLRQGGKILQEGQRVEFGVRRTPRGPEAVNVMKLPKRAKQTTNHPEHNRQISKEQMRRVKRRQKGSDSKRTKTGPFVYSYTIRKS